MPANASAFLRTLSCEADQMTAKLQNAEPLMAPDLRVKAMKEAYAGRGAAARQRGSAAAVGDWIGR